MNLTRGRWGSVKDSEGRMLRPSGDSDSGSDCVHTLHFAPLYILSDKTHYKVSENILHLQGFAFEGKHSDRGTLDLLNKEVLRIVSPKYFGS